jgi:MerR family transcriptional regulator, heat shock protein HspR
MAKVRFHEADEPVYVISVAARLLGVGSHVLRALEREGLLEPARTEKNIRLYSENDLLFLHHVCQMMHEEGINIPGIKAILRLETMNGSVTIEHSQSGPVTRTTVISRSTISEEDEDAGENAESSRRR